jgi:spore maturation protein CgeB
MRITLLLFKYEYGSASYGESQLSEHLTPEFLRHADEVDTFYLEEHGYPDDLDGLQQKILRHTRERRPDALFFVPYEDEIHDSTLDSLNAETRTIALFFDDDWRYDSYVRRRIGHVSLGISVVNHAFPRYARDGFANVLEGHLFSPYYEEDVDAGSVRYEFETSFIGQWNLTRQWYVDFLRRRSVKVACFGHGWPAGRVSTERMKEIVLRSRINLNLSNSLSYDIRFHRYAISTIPSINPVATLRSARRYLAQLRSPKRIEQMKNRTIEIPALGGFQLAHYGRDMERYFHIGKEIAAYSTADELALQVAWYLDHERERLDICRRGHERSREFLLGRLVDKAVTAAFGKRG